MASLASNVLGRAKETWGRFNPAQRWLAGGLGLALAGAIGLGLYLNRTEWVVLVSQADPKDAAAIVARLQELKVPYRPTGDGFTITVPKAEQYTAKLALAQAGLPKGSTSVGMELFDEPKFGATEFDRKVNYLRAQQGELERALLRIGELEYANVKLAIPEPSVFAREQKPVTAAVLIQPRSGSRLSPDQINGIVNFVSSSVQGLAPENVKVVDQSGRLLNNGLNGQAGLDTVGDVDQFQRQQQLQREVEQRVQTLLEPIFGAGNVVARVNLELNLDASRIENNTVGGSTPAKTETNREAAQGTSAPVSNGTATTSPDSPPVYQGENGVSTDGDSWKSTTTTEYAVSQRKEVTIVAPGAVKRISVGIAVNRTDLTPDQVQQIQQTVAGATGADATSISVAAMPFNREVVSPVGGTASQPFKPMTLALGLGAAGAVLLLGFLVTRRRKGEGDGAEAEELLYDGLPGTVALAGAAGPVGSALDVVLGHEPTEAHAEGTVPEPDAEETASTPENVRKRLEVIMSSRPRKQLVLEEQPVDDDLAQLLDELIQTTPETCAELLREWLKGG